MVAELWSGIAQDKFIRNKEWFCAQERKDVHLNENSFRCSFLLGSWRGNQGWSFPLIRS
jgi:hypothetical protein